jgi:hypothetical protein
MYIIGFSYLRKGAILGFSLTWPEILINLNAGP